MRRETSRPLFGAPRRLLHYFPSHLNAPVELTQRVLGSPCDLALQHTLLGYFLPTLSQEVATDILMSVQAGAESHLKFKLGIPASRVGGHHPLKGCARCFDE
jgi:hypothetical protein